MSDASVQTECPTTTDDIPNLTVGTLSLGDITDASSATGPLPPSSTFPGGGSYVVQGGDPLTIDEGIDVPTTELGSGNGEMSEGGTGIIVPIVLGGPNSWSLGPYVSLSVNGVTGNFPLSIIGDSQSLIGLAAPVEVGPVTISNTNVVAGQLGPSDTPGDLNEVDGQPVTLDDSVLDNNATVGVLTMNGGELSLDWPGTTLSADAVNLSASTEVSAELQPTGAVPPLESSGAVDLASAELAVNDDSCQAPGTVTTLVQAQGGLVGTFTDADGNPITNGEVVEPAYGCSTDVADPIEINYAANAVMATLESSPPSPPSPPSPSPAPSAPAVTVPPALSPVLVAPVISLLGALRPESEGVAVTLECTARTGSACDVTGKLTSIETGADTKLLPATDAKAHQKRRAILDGSARTTIPAGAIETVTVALDSTARKLLASLHELPATLTVFLSTGGTSSTVFRHTVTLASNHKKAKR
jgi:hypothetical protein